MASRPPLMRTATAGEAVESRFLVAALVAGGLPGATARWLRRADRRPPFARALDAARDAVAHAYSLRG